MSEEKEIEIYWDGRRLYMYDPELDKCYILAVAGEIDEIPNEAEFVSTLTMTLPKRE